ncbi:MAG TPA: (2Fe-2S)-binding protein [bacterium (Candidatus Stahlbacteria)]|nr:(2Fe-2S)-binding protein [Candidatus Stahlbacteria bacterium]
MRIEKHPILKFKRDKKVKIFFEGKEIEAYEGETVAAALIAAGIKIFRYSQRYNRPRGFFCAIGKCSSCLMNIDGRPNQMACMKMVKDGMQISRQRFGNWEIGNGDCIY